MSTIWKFFGDKMKAGYFKTLVGKYGVEVNDDKGHYLRSKVYANKASLKKAIPRMMKVFTNSEHLKKAELESGVALAFFDSGLVGFSSLFPDVMTGVNLLGQMVSFLQEKDDGTLLENCLRDDSTKAVKVKSVNQFLEAIDAVLLVPGNTFYFRGHSDYNYKMEPAIYRKPELINNENVIYNELLIRCPDDFNNSSTTFETLVKMQHYSLPTRLLDLTANPLVSLYFACSEHLNDDNDGEVKLLSIPNDEIKYSDSDTVTMLANLAKQRKNFRLSYIKNEKSKELLHYLDDIKKEKPYFTNRIEDLSLKSVVCVKPKLNNARIIRQDGAFLIFGIKSEKAKAANIPKHYLPSDDVKRIIIDNNSKEKILSQLEKIGISEATIYPEIDKVSAYVSKKYGKQEEAYENNEANVITERSEKI